MRSHLKLMVLLGLAIFLFGCGKTVAVVNGQNVSQKELDAQLEQVAGKNVLDSLITRKLVEQDAAKKHIRVTDLEIEKQLDIMKKSLTAAEQASLTPQKLKELRDEIRFNILTRKAIMAGVPESQIKTFYEKNKDVLPEAELSVIVVSDKNQADAIIEELKRGKEFSSMAGQFSLDAVGRERGGYVGLTSEGNLKALSPALAKAAFALGPGEISPPIKTGKGFYILKVLTKKTSFEDLQSEVERQMASDRAKTYIDDLKAKAKIDYKGDYAITK